MKNIDQLTMFDASLLPCNRINASVTISPYARATLSKYHFLKRLFFPNSQNQPPRTKVTIVTKHNTCKTTVEHGQKKHVFILMFQLTRATNVIQ